MQFKQSGNCWSKFQSAALLLLVVACSSKSDPGSSNGGNGGESNEGGGGGAAGDTASKGDGGSKSSGGGGQGGSPAAMGTGGVAASGGTGGGAVAAGGAGGMKMGGAGGMNVGGAMTMPMTGGSSGMPAAACVAPGCDDFESYNKGSRPGGGWTGFDVSGSGTLSVDDSKAYSGTKSVKMTVSPSGDIKARMSRKGPGGNEVFVRFMYFLDKKITGQGVFHWNFSMVEGGGNYIVTGGNATGNTFGHFAGGGRDCAVHGSMPVPVGKWTCLEFHVNGKAKTAETYYNNVLDEFTQVTEGGDPLPGNSGCLAGSGTNWNIPNPDKVNVGFIMYHDLNAGATMWIDDVVVSDKRVGCPK
jgi:hypothetical protein